MKNRKKQMCKTKVILFSGLGCLMFIFCSLLTIKIIPGLKDNLLDSAIGWLIGGISTIIGLITTKRAVDDVQMGMNYNPKLDKDKENEE
jgi:hypothetical protein